MASTPDLAPHATSFAAWLRRHPSLLLLTHERPDGDAFGALLGLAYCLEAAEIRATAWLKEPPQPRYAFLPRPATLRTAHEGPFPAPAAFDGVIALDCATRDRLERPAGWTPADLEALPLFNLDHHADNPGYGTANLVDPAAAATCQLLFELIRAARQPVPAAAADWFLTGLLMDTGAFRFANTTPPVLHAAANLIEAGANYATVMDGLFFHEPLNRRLLAATLLQEARFHFGHRLMLVCLTPERLAQFGVTPAQTEGLIDILRVIDGVQITALLQVEPGATRISLRARDLTTPVDAVAHDLGGGGHRLAAGIKLAATSLADAEQQLLTRLTQTFA